MKIAAVGVVSKDMRKTVQFYELLGFNFPDFKKDETHLEPITEPGQVRLMLDSYKLAKELIEEEPKPSNHSHFAIECDSPEEVNQVAKQVSEAGFKVVDEPWDAFWGQRYCVVEDPDGYKVDLFASLK